MSNQPESFLERYDRAPESQKWSLILKWFEECPIEFFTELREKRPLMQTSKGVLIARFDDIIDVLKQPGQFRVTWYIPKMGTYLMTQDDTFQHDTEKGIMLNYLNQLDLLEVRKFIGETGAKILDKAGGKIDMGFSYARMVPAKMVQDIFGLGMIKPKSLIRWSYWAQYDTFHNQPFHERHDAKKISTTKKIAGIRMGIYLALLSLYKLIRIFLHIPGKDVATQVLKASYPKEKKFTLPRQILNIGGLLIGSVETTSQAVIQAVNELFNRPEKLKEAIAFAKAGDNEAFDRVVWEAMRFNAPFGYMFRVAKDEYTLAKGTDREIVVKSGETVFPLILSGMFDPAAYPDPFQFDITRPFGHSFQLGYGYHECMGKAIGMQMIPEMVRQILLKTDVGPDGPIDYGDTPLPQSFYISWKP